MRADMVSAVLVEREACAALVEDLAEQMDRHGGDPGLLKYAASLIRARKRNVPRGPYKSKERAA